MSKKVTITRPVYYRPIERHWYRLVDVVQPRWRRFANSRTGYVVGLSTAVLIRVLLFMAQAIVIVGCLVLYSFLMFAMTGGKKKGGRR